MHVVTEPIARERESTTTLLEAAYVGVPENHTHSSQMARSIEAQVSRIACPVRRVGSDPVWPAECNEYAACISSCRGRGLMDAKRMTLL